MAKVGRAWETIKSPKHSFEDPLESEFVSQRLGQAFLSIYAFIQFYLITVFERNSAQYLNILTSTFKNSSSCEI